MALSDQRKEREGSYINKGIEYVTIPVAAERVHRTRFAIDEKIKQKRLRSYKFKDKGLHNTYVNWEKCKAIFDGISETRNPDGSKKKTTPTNTPDFELKDLTGGELAPVEQKEMPSLVDVDDPENSDCWMVDNQGRPKMKNGHHVILYDKFKQKYDALIRKQQFEREKGALVSKDLVDTAFSKMLTPLVNTINQIPDRYASRVIGLVESFTNIKLDNSQITSLRSMLDDEAKAITETLKKNEEDALDGLLV